MLSARSESFGGRSDERSSTLDGRHLVDTPLEGFRQYAPVFCSSVPGTRSERPVLASGWGSGVPRRPGQNLGCRKAIRRRRPEAGAVSGICGTPYLSEIRQSCTWCRAACQH